MSRIPMQAWGLIRTLGAAALLALMLATPSPGQEVPKTGARAIPRADLVAYAEWDGLDAHADAWKQTAAYKLLHETSAGKMLEELAGQLIELLPAGPRGRPALTGAEGAAMARHVVHHGLTLGVVRTPGPGREGEPLGVVVLHGAGRQDTRAPFEKLLRGSRADAEAEPLTIRGREITIRPENPPRGYFTEGDDLVVVLGGPGEDGVERVLNALDGETPSAVDHPIRQELARAEGGFRSVGRAFLDLRAIPLPPQAKELGLDGVEQIDHRWGFHDEAIVTVTRVVAPAPRRGLLKALDQPTFNADSLPPLPAELTDFSVVSIDWEAILDAAATMPQVAQALPQVEQQFRQQTGLRLREDVLRAFGPKWTFYVEPQTIRLPLNPWAGLLEYIFHPPKITALVEVRDREAFRKDVAALTRAINREMARNIKEGPVPEIVPLDGDAANGYVLDMPPEVAPLPQGLRPALAIGERYAALAISPREARAALEAKGADILKELGELPDSMVALSVSDPRHTVPEVIANLPFFLQLIGRIGQEPDGPRAAAPLASLRIDPNLIPEPDAMAKFMFPAWFATTVDDRGLTLTSRESIPSINPLSGGPVMIGLLLPAVQSAREAARRAQCTNNLKQIALAMHNYHDTFGHFPPAAITDSDGKPLLSWRVAILPFLEQAALYNEFHLDEPWDSPHNLKLAETLVPVYACPSSTHEHGTTPYRVFVGNGAAFDMTKPARIADFTDGTSNTLLVVESNEAVPWTRPEGIEFDPDGDPSGLIGSFHSGGANVAFADGSVRFLKDSVALQVLKALITRAGGEVIGADQY